MNPLKTLKKAWEMVRRYRALWLFGALLALTTSSLVWLGFRNNNSEPIPVENQLIISESVVIQFPGEGVTIDFSSVETPIIIIDGIEPGWLQEIAEDIGPRDFKALGVALAVQAVLMVALYLMIRYTSEAALIRMVDDLEENQETVGVRQGFRLGWSRTAGIFFLIDLATFLPLVLATVLLLALAVSPLFMLGLDGADESLPAIVSSILFTVAGLSLLVFTAGLLSLLLSVIRPVMQRACAVDGLGVFASIRRGLRLLRARFKEVMVTWLLELGIRIVWTVLLVPVVFLLVPVLLITVMAGIMAGVVPGLLTGWIAGWFASPVFAWIIGLLFALPVITVIAFAPVTFVSGLVLALRSSYWTLSYREYLHLEDQVLEPAAVVDELQPSTA